MLVIFEIDLLQSASSSIILPSNKNIFFTIISGNDNIIHPGEEAELFIILFNNPEWGNAINVQATLLENNSYDLDNTYLNNGEWVDINI